MGDRIKVIWFEPTDRERHFLRRYRNSSVHRCNNTGSYCNAMTPLGDVDILWTADGCIADREREKPPITDSRWPTRCEACGEAFGPDDPYQLFTRQIWVRPDTAQICTIDQFPPGACWDAWWYRRRRGGEDEGRPSGSAYTNGPDGRTLIVRCPDGHDWMIDSRASNCGSPCATCGVKYRDHGKSSHDYVDSQPTHHCWVRRGKPEDGTLHVDKNGHTCDAGAGSIQTPSWHGFLHHGELHT